MVIKIDGIEYKAKKGQTVLDVARENGIYIPTLCYHKRTGQAGKCRACVVEIEGMRGLQTACTVAVTDGMVVSSDGEKVLSARRMVVDLMLSSGRHDCLSCEKSGECELQEAAYRLGIERPTYEMYGEFELDNSSEFIIRDDSKCIKCGRCIEGCNKNVVNEVLDFGHRSSETKVICDEDLPMGKSTCVQCGECLQLCPTGAIIDKRAKGRGRTWELSRTETVCPYCGVGCRLVLHVDKTRNKIVKVTGAENGPANNGMLCVKGRFGFDFVSDKGRLTTPLIKENGLFRKASWNEAFNLVGEKLAFIKDKYGADSIGGLASAKCTNEENYLFQKFIRTRIVTNNIDHCARL